jgi:hypothetical protein
LWCRGDYWSKTGIRGFFLYLEENMIRTAALSMLILYGVVAIGTMASAQQKDSDLLKFSGTIYGEQTDNRDGTAKGEKNFDTYIKPRMDIHLLSEDGATTMDMHYAPYYRYRTNPSPIENDTELFHDLMLTLLHQSSPATSLRASEYFYRTDDPSIDVSGVNLRRDCSYMLNYAEVGMNYKLSDRLTCVDLAGRSTVKRYDDSVVAGESDENNMGVCLTAWRQVQRTLAALAVVDVAKYKYDSFLGIERGFNAISGGAGLEKIVNKNLSLNLRGGMIAVNYEDKSLKSESKPFVSLDINATTTPAAKINATVAYLLRDSDVYPFASQECIQLDTTFDWAFSELLSFGVNGTYRIGKYSNSTLTPLAQSYQSLSPYRSSGDKKTLVLGGDITYKFGPVSTTAIKLSQTYEKVDSDVSISYHRNATGLMLTQQF